MLKGDSTHKMKRDQLNVFIKQAFKESIYPGDDNIVRDNSERHIDCRELREQLQGKTWLKVSDQVLQNIKSETAFFSESGMHYYLPALMLFIINDFERADTLTHNVVSLLTLPAEIDIIIVANKIKNLKLDRQLSEIDFSNFLTEHLRDINDNVKRFIRFGSLFKFDQGLAVRLFLEYLKENHSSDYEFVTLTPQVAIDRYWFIFK